MYTLRIFMETTHIIVDHQHHVHQHHRDHRHHGHHHRGKCTNLTACDYSTTNQGGLNHKMTVMSFSSITPSSSSSFLSSYRSCHHGFILNLEMIMVFTSEIFCKVNGGTIHLWQNALFPRDR